MDVILPVVAVDEGIDKSHGAVAVPLQGPHLAQLEVGDGSLDEFLVEVSAAKLRHGGKEQVADFLEGLALFRVTVEEELAVIGACVGHAFSGKDFLLLDEVDVHDAGHAVAEHCGYDVGSLTLDYTGAGISPADHNEFGFSPIDILLDWGSDGILGTACEYRKLGIGLPVAEVLLDYLHELVRIEVSGYADGGVVRNVVGGFLLLDRLDGRILQVVGCTDDGLGAVRMILEQHGVNGHHGVLTVLVEVHVVLLVDSLQFGVESADDHVLEAV